MISHLKSIETRPRPKRDIRLCPGTKLERLGHNLVKVTYIASIDHVTISIENSKAPKHKRGYIKDGSIVL